MKSPNVPNSHGNGPRPDPAGGPQTCTCNGPDTAPRISLPFGPGDPLSLLIQELSLHAFVARPSRLTAPWGIAAPATSCSFYAVRQGRCLIEIDGHDEAVSLTEGDLIVLPRCTARVLRDSRDSEATSIYSILSGLDISRHPGMEYGGGGAATTLIFGGFIFDHNLTYPFLDALPDYILLSGRSGQTQPWLNEILALIDDETHHRCDGSQAIVNNLVGVILVRAIRHYLSELARTADRDLSFLTNPVITPALRLIHSQPQADWSVQSLADTIGISRSSFAEHFKEATGRSPIAYLFAYRMQKATALLQQTNEGMKTIAQRLGYASASAFSNAFKRWAGVSPGRYRHRLNCAATT
ncbi:MAG: AraC family transcriptional regulator [Sedimentisphaerales bacterium]|nr:AraC family transcriptional regulator [Sedimentisphaerales bacterium]